MWNWQRWPWRPELEKVAPHEAKAQTPVDAVLAERADTREKITQIRTRADVSAKLIAGVATALAGYLGVAKLSDIFPLRSAGALDVAGMMALVLAVVLLVGGVIWWISLLGRVTAPIVLTVDPPVEHERPNDLNEDEVRLVAKQFDLHAKLNDAPSLASLDDYLRRSLAVTKQPDGTRAPVAGLKSRDGDRDWKPNGDLEVLDAEIRVVLVRGVLDVVRSRYREAFSSSKSRTAMSLTAAGYVGLALSTNVLVGQSSGQITRASECAKLVETQLTSHLRPTRELPSCRGLAPDLARAYERSKEAPTTPPGASPSGSTPAPTTP